MCGGCIHIFRLWFVLVCTSIIGANLYSQAKMATDYLSFSSQIDSIIANAIDSMAFPGAQVLVAKGGEIVFEKAYGYHTYNQEIKVKLDHMYDLASITKVTTGLPLLMNLVAKGKIDLDKPISTYIPMWKRSNKADITIREILAHQAGLLPYIVYYAEAQDINGNWKKKTFKNKKNKKYSISITDSLFMHKKYHKKMSKRIRDTRMGDKNYKYSGLFFQLLPKLIENIKGRPFLEILNREIYHPIGVKGDLMYLPAERYPQEKIVPTEMDTLFRHQMVHGTVHDEAAAMWGGVSCNAGLFGNAKGLAQLFQVYLDNGRYKGRKFIDSTSIVNFTQCQYCDNDNRRGLGFDKPLLEFDEILSTVAKDASRESFGHSGFTGTLVWADPKHDLVYVFLSNRVYPTREQRHIYTMNVRPKIHQVVYDYFVKELDLREE